MSNKSLFAIIGAALIAIVVFNCLYIVTQTQRAVLLEFGKVAEPNVEPGLHFKLPYINQVRIFDGRILTLEASKQRFLTSEKKAVMVDAFAKWQIENPEQFYTAVSGDRSLADDRLRQRLESGLRNEFGKRTLREVVSGQRDELMATITASLNKMAMKELGIKVIDVRVKAIDLPNEVSNSVFERMRTEREREAREHRAQGRELAEGIRADADRQKRVILADAYRDAEKIRGEGDAKATIIYANAFGQDTEFYAFIRSLQAYRQSFADKSDVLVLSPDNEFFKYLENTKR